jgi:hypothetical protein
MRYTFHKFQIVQFLQHNLFPPFTEKRRVIDGCMILVSRVDIETGVVICTQGFVILRSQEFVIVATLAKLVNT